MAPAREVIAERIPVQDPARSLNPARSWNVGAASPLTPKQKLTASTVFSSARNDARSMPAVYRCTRSTAARMSSMRRRQSLAGTDRLGKDPRSQLALDGILHDQIDWSAENGFQPPPGAEEMEEPHRFVELDQEVDVAARTRVAARDGAEEIKRSHAEAFELCSVLGEPSQGFLARNDSIIGQPSK